MTTHDTKAVARTTNGGALSTLLADPDRLRDFPVETVERLFAMDKEMRAERARQEFNAAMNRVQAQLLPIKERGKNEDNRSTYALLEDVAAMVDPILVDEGFSRSLSTIDSPVPDMLRFVMTLRHAGGHEAAFTLDAPIDDKGPKGGPVKTRLHGVGSTYTYVERVLLCKVLGIQTFKDDDGRGGGTGPSAKPITQEQAVDLRALMDEVKADEKRFCKFFRVEKPEELPVGRYREAVRMLESKRARQS